MESGKVSNKFIKERYPDTEKLRLPVGERFKEIEENPRRLRRFEQYLTNSFVLDVENNETLTNLARSLHESEKKITIERGQGGDIGKIVLSDQELLAKYKNVILEKEAIQRKSLASWFNYIKANDANYPMWFRYYVVRSLKSIGQFSRDGKTYANRTEDTIASFPDMNAEALGFVFKALEHEFEKEGFTLDIGKVILSPEEENEVKSKVSDSSKIDYALKGRLKNKRREIQTEAKQAFSEKKDREFIDKQDLNKDKKEKLSKELLQRLETKDFAKLYAFAQVECAGNLDRTSLEGEWVKYEKGSNYTLLENGLKGKGTGWCTAEGAAKDQIDGGDFYVFYTKNKAGVPTEPRIAIRMQDDLIAEIRGVDPKQELEPDLVETAKEKYKDLPGAQKYEKADKDMGKMTEIYNKCFRVDKGTKEKTYLNSELTKDELTFLYEIDSVIEGFGYEKDPRIEEIRSKRNKEQDSLVIFECTPEQIAHTKEEIRKDTKAYIGEWNPEVLNLLPEGLINVYEKFPDEKVFLKTVATDLTIRSGYDAKKKLKEKGYRVSEGAMLIIDKTHFSQKPISYELVSFSVKQLGFSSSRGASIADIYAKAKEFGLELCPTEVGPLIRLQYDNQPSIEHYIAMDAVDVRIPDYLLEHSPTVETLGFNPFKTSISSRAFFVRRDEEGLLLGDGVGSLKTFHISTNRFVFLRRKL